MKVVEISPKKLSGSITVPPSKSMAHRAVICAALSKGISKISNVEYSDDIEATIEAMKALGSKIERRDGELLVDGRNIFENKGGVIDCNESGSTLRFSIPLSIASHNKVQFIGKGNLGKRPLTTFYNIFDNQGIKYSYEEDKLNLYIDGKLKSGEFRVEGNISSQFISGLLFTLPLLQGDSKIIITTNLESKGYIDLTLDMMKKFGVKVTNNNYEEFLIEGNQSYIPQDYEVEGDYSQGAFYICGGALGNEIKIKGLDLDSFQGDKEVIDIVNKLGARIVVNEGIDVYKSKGKGAIIDGSQCPDVIPVVAVLCALSEGRSEIINVGRLRIKECDRLKAISTEMNKIGANIEEKEDSLIIDGVESLNGGKVHSWNDHRIAMSLAIAATCCKEKLIIEYSDCVKKSYPSFWEDYRSLGGDINEWSMGE